MSDNRSRERFRTFVNSPYFNQHQPTIKLLHYLLKQLDRKKAKLSREEVFQQLFPKTDYDEQLLFNTMSSLKKLYHRFLAHEQLEAHAFLEDTLLLEATNKQNQFGLLKNRAKQLDKRFRQSPHRDGEYYLRQFDFFRTMGYYYSAHEDRTKVDMLQDMLYALDKFYLAEKLRNACHLTANMILLNTQFDFGALDELLLYYQNNPDKFAGDHSIELYYTILMSLREEEEEKHYNKLKSMMVDAVVNRLNQQAQSDLFKFSTNYCIRHINKGERAYQKELFELYQRSISTGLILEHGLISEWDYKNINSLGCALGEFEWTANFLEEYRDKLPQTQRENAYNFNMGHLQFSKKNYSEALEHLLPVRFSDVNYHLSYNNLLLATYYAMGDIEALMSFIETYRIYVIRNRKMTSDRKRQYTNFLRFAKKLTQIKASPRTYGGSSKAEKFAELYFKIKESTNLVNRYWLEKTCREEAGSVLVELETQLEA
jgi:hypothetical protein